MAIEKLKNNPEILDMTAPPKDEGGNSPVNTTQETTINLAPHTPSSRLKVSTSGGTRNRVSIADLKGEEKIEHGNPNISKVQKDADSLIDPDNPNSMFSKYYKNKVQEYNARMQEEEDKIRDAVEAGDLDPNSEVAKSWLGDPAEAEKQNTVRTADIVFDDDDEEEEGFEYIPEPDPDDLDDDEDIEDEEEDKDTFKVEDLLDEIDKEEEQKGMAEVNKEVAEAPKPAENISNDEANSILNDILADEEDDEDNDDDYKDTNVILDDDDDEEEAEEVESKPIMTVQNNPKKEEKKEEEKKSVVSKLTDVNVAISSKKSELKDDDEEEEDGENSANDDELVNKLRKMATEKLKPKHAAIDISNFAIGKASVKNINPVISIKENKIAKWVLINQEQIVLMREFSGVELQTFVETANANNATNFSRRMRLLYNHIESPKPSTFETWLKCTPYSDLDHYYFGVYVASFNGANYMPIDCAGGTKCSEGTFVSDDVPIMNLVKFTKDDVKAKFKKIYKEESTVANPEGKFVYNIVPVNDSIAIGFKEPMLYDFIETVSVDDTFARKYGSVINLVPYINEFYVINQASGTLDPVGYSEFPGNASKTYRSKIRKYNTLLSYLSSDEYSMIEAYANDIRDRDDGIKYITPSLTCPYCGTESQEIDMSAETLVFTRYQLGALVNTTLK